MPAKTKYLSSGWTRFSKILAIIFGAYAATSTMHIALAKNVVYDTPVLLTSTFTSFLVWIGLMVMVFLIKKAWVAWLMLLGLIGVSCIFIFVI